MGDTHRIRVAVNGYGVIGKRVAAAVVLQEDMSLAGVSDVVTDWRAHMVTRSGFSLFGATTEHADAMRSAGLTVTGTLDELLGHADVVVDCTPKRIAAKNIEVYRRRGLKVILQGGETQCNRSFLRSGVELFQCARSGGDACRVVQHHVHRANVECAQEGRVTAARQRDAAAAGH